MKRMGKVAPGGTVRRIGDGLIVARRPALASTVMISAIVLILATSVSAFVHTVPACGGESPIDRALRRDRNDHGFRQVMQGGDYDDGSPLYRALHDDRDDEETSFHRVLYGGDSASAALYKTLVFSTSDVSADARYSKLGIRYAPLNGIDASGPLVATTFSAGSYRYRKTGRRFINGLSASVVLAAGYQIVRPRYGAALLAGPAADYRTLVDRDPGNQDVGFRATAHVVADLWAKPLRNVLTTFYARGEGRYGDWYAKAFTGYDIGDSLFLGPELAYTSEGNWTEHQLGLSLVGLPARRYRAKVTAGIGANSDHRSSRFLSVALWRRF